MKILKVLYYYYFFFYKKALNDDQPKFSTLFSLSATLGFIFNGVLDAIHIVVFCRVFGKWSMISVFLFILGTNYYYFKILNKELEIINEQPMFFGNEKISKTLSLLFFLVSISWLFWGPILGKYLLSKCQ